MLTTSTDAYDDVLARFQWQPPATYNMAAATLQGGSDRLALLHVPASGPEQRFTFGDLDAASSRLANALRGLGVERGDRVAIFLPQQPEVPLTHLANWKLGAISQPLSTLFGPDALASRLSDAAPKVVVCASMDVDKVQAVAADLGLPVTVVVVGAQVPAGTLAFSDLVREGSAHIVAVETAAEDPAFLSYTSGTTGPAKGVLHAHRTLLGHLEPFRLSQSLLPQDGDLGWTAADWAWMGGFMDLLFPSWAFGVPALSVAGRFDPERAWRICADHGVRNTFLPPTALRLMRETWDPSISVRLRSVSSGGETLGADVLAWARESIGVTVNELYGQTEANLVIGNCAALFDPVEGSMGRPYPGATLAVVDADGHPVPDGDEGEIAVRADAPTAFLGYWNNPASTAQKVQHGWILTGDSGVRDAAGFYWYRARTDDVISSAGYRIGPTEIETCLAMHASVRLAAVVGIPDPIRGEAVKAFIELRDGHQPSEALATDIQRHVRERVAAYLYPRHVEFVTAIPVTTTGKLRRSELRALELQRASTQEVPA